MNLIIRILIALIRIFFCPSGLSFKNARKIELPRSIKNAECLKIGERFYMREGCIVNPIKILEGIEYNPSIEIGNDVYIGRYCQIHCMDRIWIGNGVVISEYVYISDLAHGISPSNGLIMKQPLVSKGAVVIGSDSLIGFRAALMPGITLGKNCIVGVGAVVNKSFPDGSMIAGVPAKLIKKYNYITGHWDSA